MNTILKNSYLKYFFFTLNGRPLSALGFLHLSQQKSPTAEILYIYFLGTIVRRKYLPRISAVGLFSCDKFEETSKQKVMDLSKFKKNYFSFHFYAMYCALADKLRNLELSIFKKIYNI